jgi:hypothetical protein
MSARVRFFALLTVVGFVVPNVFVATYIVEHGWSPGNYLGDWFQTLPAAQITVDLMIVGVAFLVWAFWEGRRIGERRWWWTLPASYLVGLCFAVPLFLWMRERRLEEAAAASALPA